MEMVNCLKCGKVFNKTSSSPICKACEKEEEEIFETVRKYLEDHPDCSMAELSDATKVTPKKILRYIKEGRIEISKSGGIDLRCTQCGKPIKKGRYCDQCVITINQEVSEMFKKKSGTVMHTYNKDKK